MTKDVVTFKNVSKVYRTGKMDFPALNEISFSVAEGEFMSLAGPSGSGKTTILNIIGCLDKPTGGTYLLEDRDISQQLPGQLADIRRHHIGFIFQTFNLIPILTARENVEFPLILKGDLTPKERNELVEEILTDVGLKELMDRKPTEMSGGQQQRVSIARALVKKPRMVLADEPTANLDSQTGREVLELMLELNKKTGATFIFSTHDKMVIDFAHRIIRLRDGHIEGDEIRS